MQLGSDLVKIMFKKGNIPWNSGKKCPQLSHVCWKKGMKNFVRDKEKEKIRVNMYRKTEKGKNYLKEWRQRPHIKEKNKSYNRKYSLKSKFGLSLEQYNELYKKQNNRCAICLCEQGKKSFHVDHDHITGKIRGLLCPCCNLALGSFKDSILVMKNAIIYLEASDVE